MTDSVPLTTIVAIIPPTNWLSCGFALFLASLAFQGFFRLRTTTLAAPCVWVMISAASLACFALLEPKLDGMNRSALQFFVAATTLCPLMAVLGAKRPQDSGWQWVVLTLWIILVWPATQAILLPAGVRLELFIAWKLFLWALITIGLLNYLPTRHWRAAILVACGQILLLSEHLGLPAASSTQSQQWVAILAFLSAAGLATSSHPTKWKTHHTPLTTYNSQWLSFRDGFGAFWALRVLSRINQTAETRDWPLRLNWLGFVTANGQQPSEEQFAELDQTLNSMLRRFIALDSRESASAKPS